MFTPHQSLYFAHWLTLTGRSESQVSRTMASARVDMNPHQIDAACFALKSPLARGVLLADEVGLGKTIEAGLVLAQKWAERKRAMLLVVPAALRKQWQCELEDKFELPALILDSQVAGDLARAGALNPFEQQDRLVICSYEFAARRDDWVGSVPWDLVVFDEAHRLRNLYRKDGNKTARRIHAATLHAGSKLLLSATPIQNNLMELYGLAKVIDDHFFGDDKSFRTLYVNRQRNRQVLADLKQRIAPLCHRTLRRQVQEEGGINFTNRYSLTQDFTPGDDEWALYQRISAYLQRERLHALQPQARHLVGIGMRKILASSSFAIAGTLERMIRRLEERLPTDDATLDDLEEVDDWRDRFEGAEVAGASDADLEREIVELRDYHALACRITRNAKCDALLAVLGKALDMTENLGGRRKAVIFTESCRTQRFIQGQLEANGYAGRVVLLNGSNNDPQSRAIHREWLAAHAGSAHVTGSRSADMKAALVDRFKGGRADILVSTEAGGEGINLQFCSLLINYDLPWNPQKVEQRIGRVHRYGQANDVVVVNFVNRRNPADRRVFDLLNEKFKLFEGVFGASDEILGAIEGDIDIEQRIYGIYQQCRSDEQIEYEFNRLQGELEALLTVREEHARQALLNHFDRDVVARLVSRRDRSRDFLDVYEQVLLDLARAELSEAQFGRNHFVHRGRRYDLRWEQADRNDTEFFRLQAREHRLAWDLVHRAKGRRPDGAPLPPARLRFHYGRLVGQYAALESWLGQGGSLRVDKLSLHYAGTCEERLLVAARTDAGQVLPTEDAEHLLRVPAEREALLEALDTRALEPVLAGLSEAHQGETRQRLEQYFEQETDKLERWADDRRQALQLTIDELDRAIRELKRGARQLSSLKEKLDAKRLVKSRERERDRAMADYHEARKAIERQEDELLDDIEARLDLEVRTQTLLTLHWTLTP